MGTKEDMSLPLIGIDPSSRKLALVITDSPDDRDPDMEVVHLSEDHVAGAAHAFRAMSEVLTDYSINGMSPVIYMEAPVQVQNANSLIVQAQIGGAVMAAAGEFGCRLVLVQNKLWKSNTVGNGNCTKEDTVDWLEEAWPEAWGGLWFENKRGEEELDLDLSDAAAIHEFGRSKEAAKLRIGKVVSLRVRRS